MSRLRNHVLDRATDASNTCSAIHHQLLGTAAWEACGPTFKLVSLDDGSGTRDGPFSAVALLKPARSWLSLVHAADSAHVESFLKSAPRAASPIEYRLVCPDGQALWIRHWIFAREEIRPRHARLRGILQAIREEKRVESETLRVSEQERTRIGQELHDDICQVLAGLSYMMRVVLNQAEKTAPAVKGELGDLNDCLAKAMNRTRAMAHSLYPAQIEETSMRDALLELVEQIKLRFEIPVSLSVPLRIPAHFPDQMTHVYRIVQEAVTNSIRHGKATEVHVTVKSQARGVDLRIEDNGSCSWSGSADFGAEEIGARLIQYRAGMLGGEISFGNRPKGGSFLRLVYRAQGRTPTSSHAA